MSTRERGLAVVQVLLWRDDDGQQGQLHLVILRPPATLPLPLDRRGRWALGLQVGGLGAPGERGGAGAFAPSRLGRGGERGLAELCSAVRLDSFFVEAVGWALMFVQKTERGAEGGLTPLTRQIKQQAHCPHTSH